MCRGRGRETHTQQSIGFFQNLFSKNGRGRHECCAAGTFTTSIHAGCGAVKLLSETGKDAAELSEYLCDTDKENMRYLVELFLDKCARQELFAVVVKDCILELFDNHHVLLCMDGLMDGLDEAAPYQDLVEDVIDKHVAEKSSDGDVRMLISTREHSYVNSRKLRRLADFDVVKLQPLDKDQQLHMIKDRLIRGEQVEMFLQQLAGIADKNPELATSPFFSAS